MKLTTDSYTIRLNVTQGTFDEFFVLDGDGEQVTPSTKLPFKGQSLNFTLDQPVDYAFLAAITRDKDVNVQYALLNATKSGSAQLAAPRKYIPLLVAFTLLIVEDIILL